MSHVRVGYLIPEWPGQTHVWMWREIELLRRWQADIVLFATRRPPAAERARHAFADAAEAETTYLWPANFSRAFVCVIWAMTFHPIGFLKAVWLGVTLPVDKRPAIKTVLPLIVPAAILARSVHQKGVNRLHSQTCSSSAILCMMVKRMTGIPFSLVLNANITWWGGAMGEKFGDADFTVTHTLWLLNQIREGYPALPETKSLLARVGVDTQRWCPAPPRQADKTTRLVSVGRLNAGKGYDVLLRAVKILVDQGRDVTLSVAGGGAEMENLNRLKTEMGLADRVRFLGSLPEDLVMAELRQSDLFVLATHAESFGVVYVEAMSLGLPVIGTDAPGGSREVISDGEDGMLVPVNDPAAMAAAIAGLMDDPDRRRRLAQAGQHKAVEKFDSRIGAAILFEKFMGHPPALVSPPAME
jgi:colanic acid/amylovoran biosynthesis glycosyltransferase